MLFFRGTVPQLIPPAYFWSRGWCWVKRGLRIKRGAPGGVAQGSEQRGTGYGEEDAGKQGASQIPTKRGGETEDEEAVQVLHHRGTGDHGDNGFQADGITMPYPRADTAS